MTSIDKNHLLIRCPSCSQKFQVGSELMGRTVECGACESRFDVNDDVVQKSAKFYPGERNPTTLQGFSRVDGPKIGMDAATPIPRGPHQVGYISPISKVGPLRLTLGWVGAVLVVATAGLLQTGLLVGEMPVPTQAILAAVVGVLALGLIVWANPRNRGRVFLIGGLAALILLSFPFVFLSKRTVTPTLPGEPKAVSLDQTEGGGPPSDEESEQTQNFHNLTPLETEIRRLAESGSRLRAVGVWLRDMSESNRISVRDYILRATSGSPSSVIYPRGDRDFLMVLTGLDKSIEEVAQATSKIGQQPKIHPDLHLVEVKVDSSVFIEGPLDKLTDKSSPAFYDLNKRELDSIQLDRVERATKRLMDAEPKIYRDDITRQLVLLVATPQVDFPDEICKALLIWAEDPSVTNVPLLNRLSRMHTEKQKIPKSMVEMLAKGKAVDAVPVVESLWLADATHWESLFEQFGPAVERPILERFSTFDPTLRHSAARILAKVGSRASIPVLEAARIKADPEMIVLIDNALHSIRERN